MHRIFTYQFVSRLRRLLLWSTAVVLLLSGGAFVYLDLHRTLPPLPEGTMDEAMEAYLKVARLPSLAVGLVRDAKVVLTTGGGFADLEQQRYADPDTVYQVASVSKLVTATAVMRLVERGSLGLDDDVNEHLPFPVRNPRHPDAPITVRMLLTHTGSILDGPAYDASYTIGVSPDPTVSLGEFLTDYFTPGRRLYDADRNFSADVPGTHYIYDSVGFGLLGFLVEQVSKEPFDAFCRREIFKPLRMSSTGWFHRDIPEAKCAMPYRYSAFTKTFTPIGHYGFATYPDGMLKTSVNDFLRFLIPFAEKGIAADGARFLQPETVSEMLKNQFREPGKEGHGLGWHLRDDGTALHFGSDPGISTVAAVSPQSRTGYVIFSNSGGPGSRWSAWGFERLADWLGKQLMEKARAAGHRHED